MSDKLPPPDSDGSSDEGGLAKKADPIPSSSLDVLSRAASSSKKAPESKRKNSATKNGDDAAFAHIGQKRRDMWSELLLKRPRTKDPRHLSSWLNEVLTVSDFDTPFEDSEKQGLLPQVSAGSKKARSPKKERKSSTEKKKRKAPEKKDNAKPKKQRKTPTKDKPGQGAAEEAVPSASKTESQPDAAVAAESKSEPPTSNGNAGSADAAEPPREKLDTAEDDGKKETKSDNLSELNVPDAPAEPPKESKPEEDDDDGFAGSYSDWRDRKKASKKGSGSPTK